MKNLKRVLSLALTGVMLIGTMAISAGAADFTDADEIEHVNAVETLVALKVINGKDDGSFDPKGNVTRAEMAKMIAVAMQGGSDVSTGVKGSASFTDIKGHWAESYIEYCYDLGIISGRGDGTFDPNGDVTGMEAAKMVLTAAGYDAEAFQLTGAKWSTRTDEVARTARPRSLFEELGSVSMAAPATRDTAAQLIWNGLQTYVVTIAPTTDKVSTGLEWGYKTDGTTTLLKQRYNADIWVGEFLGNYNTNAAGSAKGEITVQGALDGSTGSTSAHFPSDYDISFIGEQVKVVFKDGGTGNQKGQPDKYDTIYGVFNTGETQVLRVTKADVKETSSTDLGKGRIKIGDSIYDVADLSASGHASDEVVINNYYNGATVTSSTINAGGANAKQIATYLQDKMANNAGGLRGNSTDPVKFIFDTNGKICKAYVENWTPRTVLSVTSSKIQFEGMTAKNLEDVDMSEDIKADDVVAVAAFYGTDARYQVKKLDTVEGTIEAVDGSKVRIDGTWYSKADSTTYTVGSLSAADTKAVMNDYPDDPAAGVGDEYKLVLSGNYWVAADVISAATDYGMVVKTAHGITDQVRLLLADGTENTFAINKDSDLYINSTDDHLKSVLDTTLDIDVNTSAANAALVKYETLKNGTEIKMTIAATVTDGSGATTHAFAKNTKELTVVDGSDNATTRLVSDTAVIFAFDGSKWKVFNANTIGNYAADDQSAAQYALKGSKVAAFALKKAGSFPTATGEGTVYGYVTGKIVTKANDDNLTVLTVWDGSENVEITVDGTSDVRKGDFITAPMSNDAISDTEIDIGLWTGTHVMAANSNAYKIKEVDSKRNLVVTTDGEYGPNGLVNETATTTYRYNNDTKIIGVNTKDVASAEINSIPVYTKATGSDYKNVFIILGTNDDADLIKAIFVDSNNELKYYASSSASSTTSSGAAGTPVDVSTLKIAAVTTAVNGMTVAEADPSVSNVLLNEEFTYTLKISGNNSDAAAKKVTVTNGTNVTVTKVESDSADVTCTAGSGCYECSVATGKGNGVTLTVTVKVTNATGATVPTVSIEA